jgi:transcriptional regulator with XRE-family HTH domain
MHNSLKINDIETAMRRLGLNGSAVADACQVSKQAVSNWLSGESMPRASKLYRLAEALQLSVESLISIETVPKPLFAYRTKLNRPVSEPAREAAEEVASHLKQLLPYVDVAFEFEPRVVRMPSLNEDHIRKAAHDVRSLLRLAPTTVLHDNDLESLFHNFGAILVPVMWGVSAQQHENALTVYIPESKAYWVVFNVGCKQDDYKYWLAHEYGHCLTLHSLSEDDGENFAEKFAQHLVFPDEVASECLEQVRAKRGNKLAIVQAYASKYGISVVTVLRAVDRVSEQLHGTPTGLANSNFYIGWNADREAVPSKAQQLWGSDTPDMDHFVVQAEEAFKTPIFRALQNFQKTEGGCNPAFISKALNIPLADALLLSQVLWARQC